MNWKRAPEKDKRISRGDGFAGDAWIDTETGILTYVSVCGSPPADDRSEQTDNLNVDR